MTPNNREELVELMIGAVNNACYPPRTSSFDPVFVEVTPESIAKSILTALDTAGIALVPKVPTEEMWMDQQVMDNCCSDIGIEEAFWNSMISASPYVALVRGGE